MGGLLVFKKSIISEFKLALNWGLNEKKMNSESQLKFEFRN